jgi:hypothetical protein
MKWPHPALAALLIGFGSIAVAEAADVRLYGRVEDLVQRGLPIVGAKVTVSRGSQKVVTRTNEQGDYEIARFAEGDAVVSFELITLYKREDVRVELKPKKHLLNMRLFRLKSDQAYFMKAFENKAGRINQQLKAMGPEQAAALYKWEWFSCQNGLPGSEVALCANAMNVGVADSIAKPEYIEIWTTVNHQGLAIIEGRLEKGADPTLDELQQGGVPPEVAWFSKWHQLKKAGVSDEVLKSTEEKLFRTWNLDPASGARLTAYKMPKYPISQP